MPLEDHLAIIHSFDGEKRFGAGMLVDSSLVLTCAHVVNAAMGRAMNAASRPTAQINVTLLASPAERFTASLDAAADSWSAPPASAAPGADLCLLRLSNTTAVEPAKLWPIGNIIRREYRAAGYPEDWEGDLDIAIGEIVGRDEHGLYLLRPQAGAFAAYSMENNRLLSRDRRPPGVIHSGFSGGPVEVDGNMVGLIAEARSSPAQATAYMVPVSSFPKSILSFAPGSQSSVQDIDFVSQFAPGPTVKEMYLVTPALSRAIANAGEKRSDVVGLFSRANHIRLEAGQLEEKDGFGLLEFVSLPNLDAGAIQFWTECLLRAFVMGPRMLASLLIAVPDGLFDDQARRDRSAIVNVLLAHYRTQDGI